MRGLSQLYEEPLLLRRVARTEPHPLIDTEATASKPDDRCPANELLVEFYFKRQITVAHIFGIPVRFDYRWFVVFLLSVWLIAMNLGSRRNVGGLVSNCFRSASVSHGFSR